MYALNSVDERKSLKDESYCLSEKKPKCMNNFIQKFATRNTFIIIYGILGITNSAGYAYLNGTMTTMEKRFKISSRTIGIVYMGSDISVLCGATIISYLAGKGHKPRWIAFGSVCQIIQMTITGFLHFIYGAGEDALSLTLEYSTGQLHNFTEILEETNSLCGSKIQCMDEDVGNSIQPIVLFFANAVGGIGDAIFYTVGIAFLDDNIPKAQSPFLISLSQFMRLLGPLFGYLLASFCLRIYVAPTLTPLVTIKDPRWIGAWWMGWLVIGACQCLFAFPMALFPKILPDSPKIHLAITQTPAENDEKSLKDFKMKLWRLMTNKMYCFNSIAVIFYIYAEFPWYVYMSKFIETQYRQSASFANLITGTVGLVCTAIGVVLSGFVVSKFKPKARTLAAFNVIISIICTFGSLSYMFFECKEGNAIYERFVTADGFNSRMSCNSGCGCENIPFSPVCSEGKQTYISACYAGCQNIKVQNNTKVFTECSCVHSDNALGGIADLGACPVNCSTPLYLFLAMTCFLKLIGATAFASSFLVGIRCVHEDDKTLAMGFSMSINAFFSFCVAPIVYGYLIDTSCLFWDKSCGRSGNCWLYDGRKFTLALICTSAVTAAFGIFFEGCVWYYSKSLKIFD